MSQTSIIDQIIGDLEESSLNNILAQVKETGIVEILGGKQKASLFFNGGQLFNVRINNKEASKNEILALKEWNKGEVVLIKWEQSFESNSKFLDDILFLSSTIKSSLKITFRDVENGEIHLKDGVIKKATFGNKSGVTAIKKMVSTGDEPFQILVEKDAQTDGGLNLDYSSVRWLLNLKSKMDNDENLQSEGESEYYDEFESSDDKPSGIEKKSEEADEAGDASELDDIKEKIISESEKEDEENNKPTKSNNMNVKKLHAAIDNLKEQLGGALIACDIWMTNDGQVIAGHNSQPKAAALFERMTGELKGALSKAGFPGLGTYYMLVLENGSVAIILQFEKYQWGMLLDPKIQMGLLMNIVVPQAISDFNDAVNG